MNRLTSLTIAALCTAAPGAPLAAQAPDDVVPIAVAALTAISEDVESGFVVHADSLSDRDLAELADAVGGRPVRTRAEFTLCDPSRFMRPCVHVDATGALGFTTMKGRPDGGVRAVVWSEVQHGEPPGHTALYYRMYYVDLKRSGDGWEVLDVELQLES